MARKTVRTEAPIAGVHYEITQLGFSKARTLFVLLAKKIGPSLAKLADAKAAKDLPLGDMVGEAIRNLSEADLIAITETLATDAKYSTDGGSLWPFLRPDAREEIWTGNLAAWFKWIVFALTVNYSDFSNALGARKESAPEGQTTNDSGESSGT